MYDFFLTRSTTISQKSYLGFYATLSHLKENSLHTSSTTNDILFFLQETLKLQNITAVIPASCKEVNKSTPTSPSGLLSYSRS